MYEGLYLSRAKICYRWNILDFIIDAVCGSQNSVESEDTKYIKIYILGYISW